MADALLACTACDRLATFVAEHRAAHPDWHARPVPPFGDPDGGLLLVGLAPGLWGANRTGRPFCGDQSGAWVYGALHRHGFATAADPHTAQLLGATITNAVKCVPPQNKPSTAEIRACRERWLVPELATSPARVIVALGGVALASIAAVASTRLPFVHGAEAVVSIGGTERLVLASFHPSPLNTRTGRLSAAAFDAVFARAQSALTREAA